MQAIGSVMIDLVAPRRQEINIETIATVLARVPRFGAHTERGVLSVAQHSVEGALAILRDTGRRDWAAAFLLHDAHEAYFGDDSTPKIEALVAIAAEEYGELAGRMMRNAFRSLKYRFDAVIYPAAGIAWPLDEETRDIVHEYDRRMGRTERDARMGAPPVEWTDRYAAVAPVAGCDLHSWPEHTARVVFLRVCRSLLPCCVDNLQNAG